MIRFALLGLGAGAVYALVAQGVVLVYRGSGVLNVAHGAMGMVGAFAFYLWRDDGMATPVAFTLAVLLAAMMGVAVHFLVMRPLRTAPPLSRVIATLALFAGLVAIGTERWGTNPRILPKLIPIEGVELWDGTIIGRDRLVIAGVVVVLTVVLSLVYRYTWFGLATEAVAQGRLPAAIAGVSPDVVAAANWAAGSVLAVVGAILIVNLTGLQVIGLSLLVVPALAAALVGGFRSFPLTLLGGLLVGVLESEIAYLQTKVDDPTMLAGWARSVPFLVIVIVLVVRGQSLPLRTDGVERPPEVGTGEVRLPLVVPAVALGLLFLGTVASDSVVGAASITLPVAIVVLSLVVVTGYAGQLSLAQFALAGTGAWMASRAIVNYDVSFELAALIGIAGALPIGIAVGLPALRSRGVNLAVATLGLALVLEALILNNPQRTGGITGTTIGAPTLFGIDLDTSAHPARFAVLAFVCFVATALMVANLRRGRTGRRLIAVRSNERAATALGISVTGAKLYAFGLGAMIAGLGGVLLAFRRPSVVFYPTFSAIESILVVLYGVIGGIGFVLGSVIGASFAPGGLLPTVGRDLLSSANTIQLLVGLIVIGVLLFLPDGIAALGWHRAVRRLDLRRESQAPAEEIEPVAVEPRRLEARGVRVRFGGVVAVDDVSLTVEPGQVVGLIGPNGAGKTSLVEALTGFASVDAGEILLDGQPITHRSPLARARAGLGRSFQHLELFETMTVRENLLAASDRRDRWAYLADLLRPGRARLGSSATAAVREFGLEPVLDQRPDALPHGQRRLVAIARAVAANPSVLLLDEPTAGLGEHDTHELGDLIRRLATHWNMAVLLIEHDVALVSRLCDRIEVLDGGRTIASGTGEEVLRDPVVVAAYVGGHGPAPARAVEPSGDERRPVVLSARNLDAGYGNVAAVRDLDIELRAGEVVALLGANGAGKTTTVLTLAGALVRLGGEIHHHDRGSHRPVHQLARSGLAVVPEERILVRRLSAADNLRLARADRDRVLELFPQLEQVLSRPAAMLSGGEQQMLTLARALARRPRVLLADELSLGLAPVITERLLEVIRTAADDGLAVLLVDQHARQVMDVADRVCVLRRGSVVLEGSAASFDGRFEEIQQAYLAEPAATGR